LSDALLNVTHEDMSAVCPETINSNYTDDSRVIYMKAAGNYIQMNRV